MASFSLDFPDDEISSLLGDDIRVYNPGAGFTDIKGVFEHKYMEDELGDTIGISYPTVEVDNVVAHLFSKKVKVEFDSDFFSVLKTQPGDVGKTIVIMRSS